MLVQYQSGLLNKYKKKLPLMQNSVWPLSFYLCFSDNQGDLGSPTGI